MVEGSGLSGAVIEPLMSAGRTFAAVASEIGQARRFLAGLAAGHQSADDARTCLSELATNAVLHSNSRHPGGTFHVSVTIGHDLLRIEVADSGGIWSSKPADDEQRGRGLAIVAALATTWGITGDEPGRAAWCEFRSAPGETAINVR